MVKSDYAYYGRVTLVLDNNEADKLFGIPKTWNAPQGNAKGRLFLYIDMWIIYTQGSFTAKLKKQFV